jgi:SAM-dependent methyltransferase
MHISTLGNFYTKLYTTICGEDLTVNLLHFQYLAIYALNKDLKHFLPLLCGDILDFGCGKKPYRKLLQVRSYTGADIHNDANIEIILDSNNILIPRNSDTFDSIISTEVFEHVQHCEWLTELHRVLKQGGSIVMTVPFLYPIHDQHDYRRFTAQGLKSTLEEYGFTIKTIKTQGGIGSTVGLLSLSFLEALLNKNKTTRLIKGSTLPLFLLLSMMINILGVIFDKFDTTGNFYNNILVIAEKS